MLPSAIPSRFGFHTLRRLAAAWAAAMLLLVAFPTDASAQSWDESGEVIRDYERAAGQWGPRLANIARNLFGLLAGIEIALSAILWYFRREALEKYLGKFVLKFAIISFLFALIGLFETWLPPIIGGFMEAGQTAAGITALQPGAISFQGFKLFRAVASTYEFSFLMPDFGNIAALLGGLTLLIGFIFIAVQVAVALVESIVVLSAGILFLGFAPFRATAGITEGYIEYAFRVGIRLFMLYLLVGIGTSLSSEWEQVIRNSGGIDITPVLQVVAGAMVFAIIVFKIPREVASIVTGGLRLGIREGVAQ